MRCVVIDKSVDSFLEHTHFVVYDNFRSVKIEKFLQTVVAVNHTTIEVVEVRCCETTAREANHWAKIWWNNRNYSENEICRFDAGSFHAFDEFQAFDEFAFFLAFGFFSFFGKICDHLIDINFVEHFLDCGGAHFSFDEIFVFFREITIINFANHCAFV